MNIYVILKQTFDTEEKIVIQDGDIPDDGVKYVINPYDEYALEEAIRQKEQHGGSITVVSIGPSRTAEALRTALALGADQAVLITDDRIESDEFSISKVLSAYFANNQPYDLILGGNFSIDNGGGQVGIRLSQLLNIPHVASIIKLDVYDDHAIVSRDSEGDTETVKVTLPALFTAQQGLNEPRYPSLSGIMKAKKKPFHHFTIDDLGLTASEIIAKTQRVSLFLPPSRKSGHILQGELNEQASQLVHLLQQSDVLGI
ncbi:electron transfer flavoprotein subunit beta/FixA family protein [Paenibacillus glacialis]|uniref:Electron transfer flavoprotein subunit beta n=1 Tax=Paenibacillus glacialis TaxID=494026 RepID=A0A168DBL1_9BACL|nr:electron transfer flavoprotein subunit beta/FixA family protein [Paenibacillus glacialis]OAB34054.1 electron transfer flavoprotein subunit beta [Paenibacillus glacialis]